MRSWPMLMLRGTTYYFRRTVPLSLRPLLNGKREIRKSLHTSDLDEAKLLSLREGQQVERELQALRKRAERAQTDLDAFARQYQFRALAEDAEERRADTRTDDGTFESARQLNEELEAQLDALRSAVEDHREALRLQDATKVSALLDEVL